MKYYFKLFRPLYYSSLIRKGLKWGAKRGQRFVYVVSWLTCATSSAGTAGIVKVFRMKHGEFLLLRRFVGSLGTFCGSCLPQIS